MTDKRIWDPDDPLGMSKVGYLSETLKAEKVWESLREMVREGGVMDSSGAMTFTFTKEEPEEPPEPLDLATLRMRYEDDPLAMALLSELEIQRDAQIRVLGTIAQLRLRVSDQTRQLEQVRRHDAAVTKENRMLKETLDSERVKYRELIEELALATGKFKRPDK